MVNVGKYTVRPMDPMGKEKQEKNTTNPWWTPRHWSWEDVVFHSPCSLVYDSSHDAECLVKLVEVYKSTLSKTNS